jgi:hypothetical protein
VDSLYVAMVRTVAILVASMVSVELALSVSIIEIILGVALGNALGLSAPEWLVFLAGLGAIL